MTLPGHTKNESIRILLEAMNEPSNISILPQIKKSLKTMGLTDKEILIHMSHREIPKYIEDELEGDYEVMKKDWEEMDREFNSHFDEMEKEFEEVKHQLIGGKKRLSIPYLSIGMLIGISTVFVVFFLLMIFYVVPNKATSEPQAITEQAPVSQGDKL